MASNSPTIVIGQLNDKELQESINKLVTNLDTALETMKQHTKAAVTDMQNTLKSLGDIKVDFGGSADGGSSRRAKSQKTETEAVKQATQARKEYIGTLDQQAAAEQKAASVDLRKNFNAKELDEMKNKLRELNAEYLKINREGGGIGTSARSSELREQIKQLDAEIKKYEIALKNLQTVGKASAPFNIKEWVENIDKADKRLAQLRAQYKEAERDGNRNIRTLFSDAMKMPARNIDEIADKLLALRVILQGLRGTEILSPNQISNANAQIDKLLSKLEVQLQLQKEITSGDQQRNAFLDALKQYREGLREAAAAARDFMANTRSSVYRYNDSSNITGKSYGGLVYAENDVRAKGLTIEEQILQIVKQKHDEEKSYLSTQQQVTTQIQRQAQLQQETVQSNTRKRFADYEDLASAIASVLKLESNQVNLADTQTASYKALSATLKQLEDAYRSLGSESRKSLNARILIESIHEVQRAMQEIQKTMSRPTNLKLVMDLPENSIDRLTYKIQMLRSYAQGVDFHEEVIKIPLDEIERLSQKLKEIQKTSKDIRTETNNAAFDNISNMPDKSIKDIAEKIRSLRQYIGNLNKQSVLDEKNLNRAESLLKKLQERFLKMRETEGTTKNVNRALKMTTNTLDEMAKKIQRLNAIRLNLNVYTQKNEIDAINEALKRLRIEQSKIMGQNKEMLASNNALVRSFNYMKNRLAFYFTVGAATTFIKSLVDIRSQYEMNERALGILINSAERGSQIFQELSNMALVSPYTLIELSSAAKQLTAYDVAARDVVDTTRRLADMAAAVGIPMERLTYALGQIKAYGYLNSRDNRMFANAGIPLVKQLADYYTELEGKLVSTADVYDRIKKKAVDYNTVMQVIYKMTDEGGKFFDFQAKMADTLKVRMANLTLAWNNMMNDIGKSQQGLLTMTIGGLRELFLHWKQLGDAIESASWTLGLVVAVRALNVGLVKLGLNWRVLSKEMTAANIAGAGVAKRFSTIGGAMNSLVHSSLAWWSLVAFALVDVTRALLNANEAQNALNKSIRDGAKDNYENITKFVDQYKNLREELYTTQKVVIGNIYNPETGKAAATAAVNNVVTKDIDNSAAKKAWEAIREQIELTTKNADAYIGRLLSIENMSERVRKGFEILDDLAVVNAAIKEIDDNTIKIAQDWSEWWNVWQLPDGLIGNLKDLIEEQDNLIENFGSLEGAKNKQLYSDYERRELKNFRDDLKETTDSILNFINLKGWQGNTTRIEETFSQIINKISLDNNLNPREAFVLQLEAENARTEAVKKSYVIRIADENAALKQARDENSKADIQARLNTLREEQRFFLSNTAESRVYWKNFTKWMGEQHRSETQAMFKDMDAAQIKSLDFTKGKYFDWIKELTHKYEKEHNMAYGSVFDTLKNYVTTASQMSIFIPLIISTEDRKKVYDILTEADQNADDAWKKIQRLEKRKSDLDKIPAGKLTDEQSDEYKNILLEIAAAQQDYNTALEKGGHSKKEDAANTKAQKQAESELQKALKEEIQLIDKVRSTYKSLYDTEISTDEALAEATEDLEEPIRNINKVLNKYGLKLDISKFVGVTNPHALTQMIQEQIDALMGKAKPAEIQSLKLKVKEYEIDAKKFDQQTFTDSLNKSLNNLKDEYELAVSLDADPELGYAFADAMGINLDTLPRTAQEYADRYTKILNEYLKNKNAGIELPHLNLTDDDLAVYEKMVKEEELNKKVYDEIVKAVNTVRSIRKKEMEEHMKSFDKLIEKYSEYEHKVMNIQNNSASARKELVKRFGNEEQVSEAVRLSTEIGAAKDPEERQRLIEQLSNLAKEVSKENPTAAKINVAITNEEEQGVAKAGLEEFQKSPEWILATGELAGMTRKAIGGLIKSLEQYKKSAKNLDPKQVKQINNALKSLYREQRSKNPFFALSNAIAMAKDKAASYDDAIKKADNDIREFYKNRKDGEELTEKEKEELQKLQDAWQQLKDAQADAGSIDATEVVGSLNTMVSGIKGITGAFTDLFKAISGKDSDLNKVFSILDKAGSTAAMGASIGGGWGAAIGAVIGGITGVISEFGENISGNSGLSRDINASARYVRELELAYVDLEEAINKAYGSNVVGAKRAMAANKELQLAELERQLQLEQERSSKYRDEERIYNLQKQIKELRYEIVNSTREIVDDLLGTDVAGFAENLVSAMITAFKNGEDYMKEFGKSFDTMVDNMIMKSIVARVTGQYIEQIWTDLENKIKSRTAKEADDYAIAQSIQNEYKDLTDAMLLRRYMLTNPDEKNLPAALLSSDEQLEELYLSQQKYRDIVDNMRATVDAAAKNAEDTLNSAQMINNSDINELLNQLAVIKPELGERLKELIGEWYTFGEDSDTQLSSLQQGIQGITEDTAGAIEAYLNIVSQKMFEQNAVMIEIRDAINGFSFDEQLGTMSLILLQLQQSYQMQSAIYSILSGWSNANGMAVRVEMV